MAFQEKVLRFARYVEEDDPTIVDIEGTLIAENGGYKPEGEVKIVQPITPDANPVIIIIVFPDESDNKKIRFKKVNIGHRSFEEKDKIPYELTIKVHGRNGNHDLSNPGGARPKKRKKRPIV